MRRIPRANNEMMRTMFFRRTRHRPLGSARFALIGLLCLASLAYMTPGHAAAVPTIAVTPSPLTPYVTGGCSQPKVYACYHAYGTAAPGARVWLTVSDDSGRAMTFATRAADSTDQGSGVNAGDWALGPNVTDLGAHGVEPSTLTFTARTDDGEASVRVTKQSATPRDVFPPVLTPYNTPSGYWCHVTGPHCITPPVTVVDTKLVVLASGEQQIVGYVEDDTANAYGIASEISDIVIRITRSSDSSIAKEIHAAFRRGTSAWYAAVIHINDFAPGTYSLSVIGYDAWGNASEEEGSDITVMPI